MMKKYEDVMQQQIQMGIIEEVPAGHTDSPLIHYLPHHHVGPKFRVVFGGDAHLKGKLCLNDCLYAGPNELPDLAGLLMRFRLAPIVVIADVVKAFLMIHLHLASREVVRFIWLKDPTKPPTPENLKIMRFIGMTFGVVSSPFILMTVIKHHLKKEGKEIQMKCEELVKALADENEKSEELHKQIEMMKTKETLAIQLAKNTYMDNLLFTAATKEEAIQKCEDIKAIFSKASMKLQEFLSSSEEVNELIPKEDLLVKEKTKFLGIHWKNDMLIFNFPKQDDVPITKRSILQTMNSFFDPLGLFTPVMLSAKFLFQKTWAENNEWDIEISEDKRQIWKEILESWKVPAIEVPRLILPKDQSHLLHQLHVCTDASEKACAVAVYLRTTDVTKTTSRLIYSKNRLAKKNETSIPRLELIGILMGVRAIKFVKKQLHLEESLEPEIFLWSDSQIALHWIQSTSQQPVFIANRLKEIRQHSDISYNYIPTDQNPADLATRGVLAEELRDNKMWWEGPKFLTESKSEWPSILSVKPPEDDGESDLESEQKEVQANEIKTTTVATANIEKSVHPFFQVTRYSTYEKLVKNTAILLKFLKFCLLKKQNEETLISKMSMEKRITAKDMKIAEILLIRKCQQQQPSSKEEQMRWNLHKDEMDIWRCQTRLQKSNLPTESVDPIFMPKKHYLTFLIISKIHQENFHAGVQMTWSEVRRNFWIPNGRRTVKTAIRSCISCRKLKGPSYALPPFPPYPKIRVVESSPFSHVGLDYLGPTEVSLNGERQKFWVLVVTCLSTRAVHLEGISDLSTTTFLNAFRRFAALRRLPSSVLSDNATNFVAASKTLEKVWQNAITSEEAMSYFAKKKIEWKTTVQHAPWEGAVYERIIGLIKTAFKSAIGRRVLPWDEMQTLISEVTATLNSRPITQMDDEPNSIMALRPNDFLIPLASSGFAPIKEESEDDEWMPKTTTADKLLKKWKESNRALNKFWHVWQSLYLDALKDRQQTKHKHPHHQSKLTPRIGEIVLVKEESMPRGFWKLGRIMELPNEDATKIRSAKILMPNGHLLTRSLKHLVPLEISGTDEAEEVPQKEERIVDEKPEENPERRVTRSMKTKQTVAAAIPSAQIPKKLTPFFFIAAVALISLFNLSGANARECPAGYASRSPKRIHSEVCKSNGTVILKLDTKEVCSVEIFCPSQQHLTSAKNDPPYPNKFVKDQFYTQSNYCGALCLCPAWADGCSQYEGPSMHTSNVVNFLTKKVLEEFEVKFCSMKPSANCSKEPIKMHVHEVKLFDGTRHFVSKLDLKFVEVVEDEFECVGNGTDVTGTAKYCKNHNCSDIGTKFCFYPKPEITYLNLANYSVPVKAWATFEAEIYPYPEKEVKKEPKTCAYCKMECVEGGVKITISEEDTSLLEVCSHHFCVLKENPSSTEVIQLQDEVLLAHHLIEMKIWSKKKEEIAVRNNIIRCKKLSVCQLIKCTFCLDHLKNPNCIPTWFIILAAIFLYATVSKLVAFLQLLNICGLTGRRIGRIFWNFVRLICRGGFSCCRRICGKFRSSHPKKKFDELEEMEEQEELRSPHVRRFKPFEFTAVVTILFFLLAAIQSGQPCSELATIVTKQNTCKIIDAGLTQCSITDSALFSLVPSGQQSCLVMKNTDGAALGMLTTEVKAVEISCEPVKMYETRSYEMKVAVSKRCPRSGSCTGEFCANVKSDTRIKELGSANEAPGHTYCEESCSWCDECFFPTAACIFFRIYAAPIVEDPFTYTVFHCPSWKYRVKTIVKRLNEKGQKLEEHETTLAIGKMTQIGSVKITIPPVATAPLPILGKIFIEGGKKTAIIPDSTSANLLMRCQGAENATNFRCEVKPDRCRCVPAMSTLNCECAQMNISEEIMVDENVLPVNASGFVLKGQGLLVYTEVPFAPIMVHVRVEDLELAAMYSDTLCRITTATVEGCSTCLHGATLTARCLTDDDEPILAHVNCANVSFFLPCGSGDVKRQIQFTENDIDLNCSISCPKGTTFFKLFGKLSSLDSSIHQLFSNANVSNHISSSSFLNFSLIIGFFKEWKLIFALAFIIIYILPKLIKFMLKIIVRLFL